MLRAVDRFGSYAVDTIIWCVGDGNAELVLVLFGIQQGYANLIVNLESFGLDLNG